VSASTDAASPRRTPSTLDGGPVLAANGVTVRFGGLTALSEVSIEVPSGTIVGLVGPNGAGKSTLFAVLSGLLRPADGPRAVARQGRHQRNSSSARPPRTGAHVPTTRAVHGIDRPRAPGPGPPGPIRPQRLWRDMVDPRSLLPPSRDRERTGRRAFGVARPHDVARASVGALPLGTSRLVEIARALATRPDVVLLDEPLSGLDMRESENLASVFRRVVENDERRVSLLMVEHDVATVLSFRAASSYSTSVS
jgi:branched-chain amino acid transport system ATP-binding protein